jgi:hypothetical protein
VSLECDTCWTNRRSRAFTGIKAIDVPKQRLLKGVGQRFRFNETATDLTATFR